MPKAKHPTQPLVLEEGVVRFKQNKIVRYLLDVASQHGANLNQICGMGCFPDEDHRQLMQLIGYSVSGYGDLSFVRQTEDGLKELEKIDQQAEKLSTKRKKP